MLEAPSNAQQIASLGERSLLALLFLEKARDHLSQTFEFALTK